MGCIQSQSPEDKMNRAITKSQQRAQEENLAVVNLFLVGSGDSGKSTIIKQLANLNTDKYADPNFRKQHFTSVIFSNLYDGVLALIEKNPSLATEQEKTLLQEKSLTHTLPPEAAELMIAILKKSLDTLNQVPNLQDCFKVFAVRLVNEYPTWGNMQDWTPSVEDCIRARVRTTGVLKQDFEIQGHKFSLVDVGGQKAERRKWMHKFEDVNALIFVTAISEYDLTLFEDPTKMRLEDSLELFEQISNSEYLRNKPMILFLNKRDLFIEKITRVPISACKLPGAPEECPIDEAKAVEWFSAEFTKRRGKTNTKMVIHVTCATDPENVRTVFNACKSVILQKVLDMTGLN